MAAPRASPRWPRARRPTWRRSAIGCSIPTRTARPTGAEVLAVLEPARAGDPARAVARRDEPTAVVGRDAELKVLAAALNEVRSGQGARLLVVRGESGVGKSSLVATFLQRLEDDANPEASDADWVERGPPLVLTARCYERELVPFKAFDGLVDALTHVLRRLDAETLSRVIPDRAAVLLQAFPVLGRVPLIAHAPQQHVGTDPREVRDSMFVAFRQLLRGLAALAPIVAFVDDLQWADADSRALLTEVLRPPDAPRMLLIGTFRTTSAEERAATLLGGEVRRAAAPAGEPGQRRRARAGARAAGKQRQQRQPRSQRRGDGARVGRPPAVLAGAGAHGPPAARQGRLGDAGRCAARAAGVVFGAGGAAAARAGRRRRARRPCGCCGAWRASRARRPCRCWTSCAPPSWSTRSPSATTSCWTSRTTGSDWSRGSPPPPPRRARCTASWPKRSRTRAASCARASTGVRRGIRTGRRSTSRRRRGGRPRRWPSTAPPRSTATRWRWGTGPRNSGASCWSAWATRWPTRDTAPRRPRTT